MAVTLKNKPQAWIGVDVLPLSLRPWASSSRWSQPFFKEKATNMPAERLLGLGSGVLAGKRTQTCTLYFGWRHSSALPLEQQYVNIFQICWSKEQELCTLAIEPSTGREKSRVLVNKPSLILCFTLNGHWLPLILKNYTESKSYSDVCLDFIFAAKTC